MEKIRTKERIEGIIDISILISFSIMTLLFTTVLGIIVIKGKFEIITWKDASNMTILNTMIIFSVPMIVAFVILPLINEKIRNKKELKDYYIGMGDNKILVILLLLSAILFIIISKGIIVENYFIPIFHFFIVAATEEIFFRGILLKKLLEIFSCVSAVVISAFLFAFLLHSNNDIFINFIIRFPIGVLLSIMTIKKKSIYPAVIVHWCYNLFVSI